MTGAPAALPAPGPAPSTRRSVWRVAAPAAAGVVVGLAMWEAASRLLLDEDRRFLLPPPTAVVREAFLRWDRLQPLLEALWLTTRVALLGLLLATLIGVGLAVVMSQWAWLERALYPYAVALQAVPVLALVPLIGLWAGFDFGSRVVVCVLVAVFPILANTLYGMLDVDRTSQDLFRIYGAGRPARIWKLQLPAALPSLLVGLRIAAGLAVVGAVVGDLHFRQGPPGLGILIDSYRARLQSEELFAAVILASLLGLVVFWLFGLLAGRATRRWADTAARDR